VHSSWGWGLIGTSLLFFGSLPAQAQTSQTSTVAGTPILSVPSQSMGVRGTAPWAEGSTGFGISNNSYGGWLGANFALNPERNVWADGYIFRAEAYAGHYDYPTVSVPSGRADVTYDGGALMLGYRKVIGAATVTGYVGGEVQNHDNPDPLSFARGTQVGVKFLGDVYGKLTPTQDFYGSATYSTAFDNWYVLARTGFLVTSLSGTELWVGPEGHLFGAGKGAVTGQCTIGGLPSSCRYDEGRVGGFLHIVIPDQPLLGDWIVSGGYRTPLVGAKTNGYYAMVSLNFILK
jgi:hypothetical protein